MHGIFFEPPIEDNYLGHQMAEIYKDRVYAPFLVGKKDLTILDIGANVGVTSYYFSRFAKNVYSLEPAKEHFQVLTAMLKYNKITNVKAINKALYIESGKLPLFKNKNKTMFSLHMAVDDKTSEEELVDCITIDQLLEENKIGQVDFMKLDIEGSETEVISSPGFRKVADKIKTIVLESHAWSGRHPNQIREALKNNGFTVERLQSDASILVAKR